MKINFNIKSGSKSIYQVFKYLLNNDYKYPLLLIDSNLIKNSKYIKLFKTKFTKNFTTLYLEYDYVFEPSYEYLNKLMKNMKQDMKLNKIDIIIAIGGGSTLDTGKGISILIKNKGNAKKYMGFPNNLNKPLPLIAIPSTTGTGSEVAFNASFVDEKKKLKLGINLSNNYPILSILDPLIVKDMPKKVLQSSASDLIVHTLESFMSTKKTPYTEEISIRAFKLIDNSFEKLIKNNFKMSDWSNLQWACVWSMIAMSNSSTGPSSAYSYLLGTHFKISHGIAGGFFLKKILFYNINNNYDFSKLFLNKKMNQKNSLKKYFNNIFKLCGIPDNIREFGVNEEKDLYEFSTFYNKVIKTFKFNPIKITKKEFIKLIFESNARF